MTVVARRVASVPVRTSTETWATIRDLLAPAGSSAAAALDAATNVGGVVISEEYTRDAPIIVLPTRGPRLRIYTVHGPDAVEAEAEEMPLASWPLEEDGWTMSLPCSPTELDDLARGLAGLVQITLRDYTDGFDVDAVSAPETGRAVIDLTALERS
jgi:hypothetical protein